MVLIAELFISLLILSGVFFVFTSALGMFRFGDIYSRLHASTKGSTLGLALVVFASFFFYALQGQLQVKEFLIVIFLFITSPVGAHILSRAAYKRQVPVWHFMRIDEWRDHT